MPVVAEQRLRSLLEPFTLSQGVVEPLPDQLLTALSTFLDLLVRWNARTNLTSIRDPETMVVRHLGESLFAGFCLRTRLKAAQVSQVLDLGSGAGFPGIPIQLLLPEAHVTLAESQGKKAAFLREAVRLLGLPAEVWADRVEAMPLDRRFDAVTMRAVDRMEAMRDVGKSRLHPGGILLEMTGEASAGAVGQISIPMRQGSFIRLTEAE